MSESPEDFLAHFGVKGMRWGHRRSSDSSSGRAPMSKKKKVAIGVGVGAVAVGAGVAMIILNKNGNVPVAKIAKQASAVKKAATETDRVFNGVNFSKLERDIGKMTMADVNARAAQYWSSPEGKAIKKNLANKNYVWEF